MVLLGLLVPSAAVLTPTAAAHDNDCVASFHFGPVKEHIMCDPYKKDKSNCTASVKVLFFRQRVGCE